MIFKLFYKKIFGPITVALFSNLECKCEKTVHFQTFNKKKSYLFVVSTILRFIQTEITKKVKLKPSNIPHTLDSSVAQWAKKNKIFTNWKNNMSGKNVHKMFLKKTKGILISDWKYKGRRKSNGNFSVWTVHVISAPTLCKTNGGSCDLVRRTL